MFIALTNALDCIRSLRTLVDLLRRKSPSLADQLERAASSIALNVAEGAKRVGKDRLHLFRVAAGSCAEVRAAIALAEAWGHLDGVDLVHTSALLDRQAALLHGLSRARTTRP